VRLIGIFSVATLIALALQTTIPRLLPIGMLMPDLALVLAVDLGLRHHGAAAALMAFGIGYATDAFAGSQLGLNALLFVMVFILTYWLARGFFSAGPGLGVAAVFGGVMLCDYGNYLAGSGWTADTSGLLLPTTLLQASVTALCAPAVFALMRMLTRWAGLRERSGRS
jgi:cell shape-determining protein MreD